MTKLTLFILTLFIALPGGFACRASDIDSESCLMQRPERRRPETYTKDSWTVWFQGLKVEDASATTFVDLGGGYGKDSWAVFYRGQKVENASAMSFVSLGDGYGKDNWKVFYGVSEVLEADLATIENLGRGYGRDRTHTYFRGERCVGNFRPGNHPNYPPFDRPNLDEAQGGSYTKDSWAVWFDGQKVADASSSSFTDLGGGYGRDSWAVFYRGRKLADATASSFEYLGRGYGKDSWAVFFQGRKIPDASPSSFRVPER